MEFREFITESTLNSLYQSTVDAFPKTTRRQHSTDSVRIVELSWTPFVGVRTLFIRGRATNEGREYYPVILFKDVNYAPTNNRVNIVANDAKNYALERLKSSQNEVLLRCTCADFKYRFTHEDWADRSLYGSKQRRHESKGIANPLGLPGMCKHLIKMVKSLDHAGLLGE